MFSGVAYGSTAPVIPPTLTCVTAYPLPWFAYRLYANQPDCALNTTLRQVEPSATGLIHASIVIPVVRSSSGASGIVTMLEEPLKDSAPPYLPAAVQAAFTIVPVFPLPEASATLAPEPSSNEYAATGVLGGGGGGGGGGGALVYLVFRLLLWLTIEHPVIGIPVDIIVIALLIYWFAKPSKKSVSIASSSTCKTSARASIRLHGAFRIV